jgi:transcriptional regulator of met regulon
MQRIKEIATKTFESIPQDQKNPEQWIDAFVLAYTKAILFEATDVIREKAKEYNNETGIILKATAIDVLDHFQL